MKWNSLQIHLSLSKLASSGLLYSPMDSPLGPQQWSEARYGPPASIFPFPSCSAARNRWAKKNGWADSAHSFVFMAQGPEPGRGPVTSSRLREFTREETALCFPIYTEGGLFCLGFPLWSVQLLDRDWEAAFVLRTWWQNSPGFLSSFFYPLTLCSENWPVGLGCHPSQQWSLTHSPS